MRGPIRFLVPLLLAACGWVLCAGCKSSDDPPGAAGPLPLPPKLRGNQLGDASSAFLRRHAGAPVYWQAWQPELTQLADSSQRLILAVLGSTLYPASDLAIQAMHANPRIVRTINENFVPVLVDVDACREMAIFASLLAAEINRPIGFPFLLWLSPDGNPVAWTPVSATDAEEVVALFDQSSSMVTSMWRESPDYVRENSARDAELRKLRVAFRRSDDEAPATAPRQVEAAVRRIRDLFDTVSGGIDGTGGLPPAGVIELLSLAAAAPDLPADLRRDVAMIAKTTVQRLLASSMVDPLDGGIFLARNGPDWNLPVFVRDTTTQCRMVVALVEAWRSVGEQSFLDAALRALAFAEAGLGTADGRVVHGTSLPAGGEKMMLWTTEDLERELDPEEYKVLAAVSQLRGLGNVPLDSDPRRQFFRLNVLGQRQSPEECAARLGMTPAAAADAYQRALRKLRKVRDQRLADLLQIETAPYARHLARLASAHAAVFSATGEDAHRRRALEHLQSLRNEYFSGVDGLAQLPGASSTTIRAGRAIDYALTAQACLDVFGATLDASWVRWAEQIVDLVAGRFLDEESLRECDKSAKVIEIPVGDTMMIFEESTAGILQSVLARMSAFSPVGPPKLTTALQAPLARRGANPIVHTDALSGELTRNFMPVIYLGAAFGGGETGPLVVFLRRCGPRRCTVVPANAGFPTPANLPADGALIAVGSRDPAPIADLAALAHWLDSQLNHQ